MYLYQGWYGQKKYKICINLCFFKVFIESFLIYIFNTIKIFNVYPYNCVSMIKQKCVNQLWQLWQPHVLRFCLEPFPKASVTLYVLKGVGYKGVTQQKLEHFLCNFPSLFTVEGIYFNFRIVTIFIPDYLVYKIYGNNLNKFDITDNDLYIYILIQNIDNQDIGSILGRREGLDQF